MWDFKQDLVNVNGSERNSLQGLMEDLVTFAFRDLVSRFDQLTIVEPRSTTDLLHFYCEFRAIYVEFENLLHLIERVTSINED